MKSSRFHCSPNEIVCIRSVTISKSSSAHTHTQVKNGFESQLGIPHLHSINCLLFAVKEATEKVKINLRNDLALTSFICELCNVLAILQQKNLNASFNTCAWVNESPGRDARQKFNENGCCQQIRRERHKKPRGERENMLIMIMNNMTH